MSSFHDSRHGRCLNLTKAGCQVQPCYLFVPSIVTEGRTGGGGTGSTVRIIQSGRAYLTLKPNASQSSSLMRFSIS